MNLTIDQIIDDNWISRYVRHELSEIEKETFELHLALNKELLELVETEQYLHYVISNKKIPNKQYSIARWWQNPRFSLSCATVAGFALGAALVYMTYENNTINSINVHDLLVHRSFDNSDINIPYSGDTGIWVSIILDEISEHEAELFDERGYLQWSAKIPISADADRVIIQLPILLPGEWRLVVGESSFNFKIIP